MCTTCLLKVCECEHVADLNAEQLEAEVWILMARVATIKDRGFDSMKMRASLHGQIDRRLDALGLRVDLDAGLVGL